MRITNAKLLVNGSFVDGGMDFSDTIVQIGPDLNTAGDLDAGGAYLVPGLVDIHTHAAMNADASDGSPEGMLILSRYYAAHGVTSWCPTTMTLPEDVLIQALHVIRDFTAPEDGARMAGVHLEGPFLSAEKCGAQDPSHLRSPDYSAFQALNEASGNQVRLITVAPELPGAMEFIRTVSREATVSLGHSAADYDTAMAAFSAGASHVTHLYNGMSSIHHRAPGILPAAADAGATVELICDGLHILPPVIRMTHRIFGQKLVLISDSMRSAGMPDGQYTLGGQPVTLLNGKCTLTGTETIAGSAISLLDGVRCAIASGIPAADAFTAASAVPADVIGLGDRIGRLAPGMQADFLLLDDAFNLLSVFIAGRQIHITRK